MFNAFIATARKFKDEYGMMPTLVIDHVDRLALYDPDKLRYLQGLAKEGADERTFAMVLVIGNGQALEQIQSIQSYIKT